jgi:hypothetical protein
MAVSEILMMIKKPFWQGCSDRREKILPSLLV